MRLFLCGLCLSWVANAQSTNRIAKLEVEVENSVVYRYDVADPAQRAIQPGPTPMPVDRTFQDFCQIDDIVRVNGRPAKGLHMTCGTRMRFNPNPAPGMAIADIGVGAGRQECNWELYTVEGRFVGRLVDGGFFPHSVQGGAGAFFGATGEHHFEPGSLERFASVAEDPSMRRAHAGGSYKVTFYVVPRYWPEIVILPQGPAIFRGDLGNPVTGPVRPGEVLTMMVKGLGPTTTGARAANAPMPPGTRPFSSAEPFDQVSSPIEVMVNGIPTDVINQIGWPGSLDTYRVDFRVPPGLPTGTATVQISAAWIPSEEVRIRVQQ